MTRAIAVVYALLLYGFIFLPVAVLVLFLASMAVGCGAPLLGIGAQSGRIPRPDDLSALEHGVMIGVKPAGGIRTAKDAMKYLVVVKEIAGEAWLTPEYFRFGASSLLNDVLMQKQKMKTGNYSGPDYVTVD